MTTRHTRYRPFVHAFVILVCIGLIAKVWVPVHFVGRQAVDFKTILPGPPAPGSQAAKQDIDEVLVLQATRDPADIARASSEATFSPFLFQQTIGPWFNADTVTQTAAFLREVVAESNAIVDQAKDWYGRKRPFAADSRVTPCIAPPESPSYPSGHATDSMVVALVLSEIFPDLRDQLIARAEQIGRDRIVAGVHYPSDVQDGQTLAQAIFNVMKQSKHFQEQLEAAKMECEYRAPDPQSHVASGE